MPIEATAPTTVSATYDRWVIAGLTIVGDGCVAFGQEPNPGENAPTPQSVGITAKMVKARVLESGLWERSPLPRDEVDLSIPDVYAFIATGTPTSQAVATAIGAVLQALGVVGQERGAL